MKRLIAILAPLATVIVLAACGGTETTAPQLPAALTGTWVANPACSPACSFTLTSVANPSASLDLVGAAGVTVDLVLRTDGSASLSMPGMSSTGTATVSGSTLYLASDGVTDTLDYTVTTTTLDLTFRSPANYDINQDGILDPVRAHAVLKKQ